MSGAQKNPRRGVILTGIYAEIKNLAQGEVFKFTRSRRDSNPRSLP